MAYLPAIALALTYGAAGVGGYVNLRLEDNTNHARLSTLEDQMLQRISDVNKSSSEIETNEEALEEIQRILIQRQGRIDLDVQRLQNDIDKQNIKLDQLLDILEQIRDQ